MAGTGDNVYLIVPPSSGLVTLTLTYKGDDNFIVHSSAASSSEGLANEIGNFSPAKIVCPMAASSSR